jgi:hypothetical protein
MISLPSLGCLLKVISMDRILYPFSTNESGLQFVDDIQKSGLLIGVNLEKFAYRNAETLLKVKVVEKIVQYLLASDSFSYYNIHRIFYI